MYLPMVERLRVRGAALVSIAPIWLPDWIVASQLGLGPLARRTARAVARVWREGGRRPLIVVGHSAGGILARLAVSPVPYRGYGTGVGDAVGAIVTLGTPHRVAAPAAQGRAGRWRRRGQDSGADAAAFLRANLPVERLAPRTATITVASTHVPGRPRAGEDRPLRHAFAGSMYAAMLGEAARDGYGDGLIPTESALLEGATQVTLPDVVHGQLGGGPWYGSDGAIDAWWPVALAAWREALAARAGADDAGRAADRAPQENRPEDPPVV